MRGNYANSSGWHRLLPGIAAMQAVALVLAIRTQSLCWGGGGVHIDNENFIRLAIPDHSRNASTEMYVSPMTQALFKVWQGVARVDGRGF